MADFRFESGLGTGRLDCVTEKIQLCPLLDKGPATIKLFPFCQLVRGLQGSVQINFRYNDLLLVHKMSPIVKERVLRIFGSVLEVLVQPELP